MTREEIREWLGAGGYKETAVHEPLVSVVCVFENMENCDDYEQIEVEFAVPIGWLVDYKNSEGCRIWDWPRVREWLVNEYTSEDSEPILERAAAENKVAFWRIN